VEFSNWNNSARRTATNSKFLPFLDLVRGNDTGEFRRRITCGSKNIAVWFFRFSSILGFRRLITCEGVMVWTPNFQNMLRSIIVRNSRNFISIPQVVRKLFVFKVWKIFAIGLYLRISTVNNLTGGSGMNFKLSGYVALNNSKKLWKFHFHTTSGSEVIRVQSLKIFPDWVVS